MRVSGWARSQGGFIDDPGRGVEDVNGVDTTGGRASFLVEATDDLSIRLSATMQDIESEAPNTANYFPEPLEPVAGDFDQFRGFPEKNDVTYDIYNGTIDWDLGWASLLSSTSYSELDQDNVQEATVALGGLLSHLANGMTQEKFTQELRLASPATKHLEWLVGLFYTDEDANLFQQVFLGPPPGTPPPARHHRPRLRIRGEGRVRHDHLLLYRAVRRRCRRAVLRERADRRAVVESHGDRRAGLRRFGDDVFAGAALAGERRHHALRARRHRLSSRRSERAHPRWAAPSFRRTYDSDEAHQLRARHQDRLVRWRAPSRRGGVLHRLGGHPAPGHRRRDGSGFRQWQWRARPRARAWSGRRPGCPATVSPSSGPAPTPRRS